MSLTRHSESHTSVESYLEHENSWLYPSTYGCGLFFGAWDTRVFFFLFFFLSPSLSSLPSLPSLSHQTVTGDFAGDWPPNYMIFVSFSSSPQTLPSYLWYRILVYEEKLMSEKSRKNKLTVHHHRSRFRSFRSNIATRLWSPHPCEFNATSHGSIRYRTEKNFRFEISATETSKANLCLPTSNRTSWQLWKLLLALWCTFW